MARCPIGHLAIASASTEQAEIDVLWTRVATLQRSKTSDEQPRASDVYFLFSVITTVAYLGFEAVNQTVNFLPAPFLVTV